MNKPGTMMKDNPALDILDKVRNFTFIRVDLSTQAAYSGSRGPWKKIAL